MTEAPETSPDRPTSPSWKVRLFGYGKEALIFLALFVVASTVIGKLRAPDLPDQAPPFVLTSVDGERVSLEDYRGQTVVLNFWATWCAPCRAEIPLLNEFAASNPEIPVVGIAVDGSPGELYAAKQKMGIDYPVLVGNREVVTTYGAQTVPTTVVVGPDGEVKGAHVGVVTNPQLWWLTR